MYSFLPVALVFVVTGSCNIFSLFYICAWIDLVDLTWEKVCTREEFWNVHLRVTEPECPEVTPCGWQDIKSQSVTVHYSALWNKSPESAIGLSYELVPSGGWFRVLKSNTVTVLLLSLGAQNHVDDYSGRSAVSSISEQINPLKRQSRVRVCVCVCTCACACVCVNYVNY